jgi:hypothetical protein
VDIGDGFIIEVNLRNYGPPLRKQAAAENALLVFFLVFYLLSRGGASLLQYSFILPYGLSLRNTGGNREGAMKL